MSNDVEIRVRVANQTGPGVTAINQSLRTLRTNTDQLSRSFDRLGARAIAAAGGLRVLDAAAEGLDRTFRSLRARTAAAESALRDLHGGTTLAGTSLRTLNTRSETTITRFDSLSQTTRSLAGDMDDFGSSTDSTGAALASLRGGLGQLTAAGGQAGGAIGKSGSGFTGALMGAAAAIGASLLPSIGAAAPMLTGFAAVGGGAALAMGDLKEKAKELKKPFEDWQKVAEKAVAPHTEKAVKSLKGAMKDLTPVIEIGADTFGRITEKAAAFADSPAFKSSLAKNAEMGSRFVEQFAGSVGDFTQAFLDFGTKSGPALDAWQNLLGGLMDTGLPSMFKELETGIGGSSDVLNGLASLLNGSLLPSLGKIAGGFADAFGPLIGEVLISTGDNLNRLATFLDKALEGLAPFADIAADGIRSLNEVMDIGAEVAGSFASSVGGALLESFAAIAGVDTSGLDRGFRGLSDWVNENQGQIRSAFYDIAGAITTMVTTGISVLPTLYGAFRLMTEGILTSIDGMVSTLAGTFGELPVIGDTFKDWNTNFDEMSGTFRDSLETIGGGINSLAEEAIPRLNRAQIKMSVDEASQNLANIKEQLKDPELTKERRAKLSADKREAEQKLAAAKRELAALDRAKASVNVGADTKPFQGAVGGLVGRSLGTSYITVAYRQSESNLQPRFSANGNIFRSFADGGTEDHTAQIAPAGAWRVWAEPETGGEAYIPLSPAKRPRSRQIAEETVGALGGAVKWFAKGGVTKAEQQARSGARGDLTVSHFGQMAGYQRSEFRSGLGNPDGVGGLVNSLNQWASIIKKATSGGAEKALLKALDSTGRKLLGWEKQLGAVTKSLDAAKSKLNELKSAASALASSVRSGVIGSANITRGATGDAPVTTKSVMAGLVSSRDKATSFAQALADLQKKGLSGSLIQQIGEAGIEGGGLETAGALLGASKSEIASMNALQSQITKAATTAGKVTSDAVYAGQIKAQAVTVQRLERSQDKLTASMDKLAASMEKMVEKAFGGKASGGIIGAASGGARSGWTMVGEHEPELVRLPFGSRVYSGPDTRRMMQQQAPWASMLNTPRGGGSAARAGGGGVQTVSVVLEVRASDNGQYSDFLAREIRKFVTATGGGNVQHALGQGDYTVVQGRLIRP
ncbi:hypothetical protein [Streptomyces sp. NBC_01373]|uniref:hypothetical protein n=1 Tax=Streptomyces sp. NBC_01373 TaxID=2903843 RepID=UPI00225146FC|nr:hypothetical protein [Streptomyces sp. NBC_01373]MCX4699534.1 hypothetical protein [Streptomyces sp. NBC_01373]